MDRLKDAMMKAMSLEGRTELLTAYSKGIQQSMTMREGIPKILAIIDEALEQMEHPPDVGEEVKEELLKDREGDLWNPETVEKIEKTADSVQKKFLGMVESAMILTRAVRAIVKTQLTLAKTNQSLCTGLLIYAMGDSISSDAAQAALKLGGGDKVLREFVKGKFGL